MGMLDQDGVIDELEGEKRFESKLVIRYWDLFCCYNVSVFCWLLSCLLSHPPPLFPGSYLPEGTSTSPSPPMTTPTSPPLLHIDCLPASKDHTEKLKHHFGHAMFKP